MKPFSVYLWYLVKSKDDVDRTIGGCKYAVFCKKFKGYLAKRICSIFCRDDVGVLEDANMQFWKER